MSPGALMSNRLRLAIISNNLKLANFFTVLWSNFIARKTSLWFLYNTDRFYFENLKLLLHGVVNDSPLRIHFRLLNSSIIIEFYPLSYTKINPLLDNMNSLAIVIDGSKVIPDPKKLIYHIYRIAGKRYFIRKKVRKPSAIILVNTKLDMSELVFVRKKFTKSEIFEYILRFEKGHIENTLLISNLFNKLSEPFVWISSKVVGNRFVEKYLLK